jgi:hypothetical protein
MRNSFCADDIASLDDVVRQALKHSSDSGGDCDTVPSFSSAMPAMDAATTHAILSQLSDSGRGLPSRLAHTPTAQALRKLCQAFVERYRTPDALLVDTAWWASEAARLRNNGGALNPQLRSKPLPSPVPTAVEREELMQRAAQLVRATHQSSTCVELRCGSSNGSNSGLQASTRHLPGALANTVPIANNTTAPAPSYPLHRYDNGDTNVLCFDDPTSPPNGQQSTWEIFEFGSGDGELHRSNELHDRMRKEEACVRVLESWLLHALPETPEMGQNHEEDASEESDTSRGESLAYVLHLRPELVTRHEELFTLLHLVAGSTCRNPTELWTTTAFTLFQALPPRAQLDFLHHMLACLQESGPRTEQKTLVLMDLMQQLLWEFAENWLPLLDSEVTDAFLSVVALVVIPFAAVLDAVDPAATWLAQWCTRPSFQSALHALAVERLDVLDGLCSVSRTSSHAACVLLHVLPYMSKSSADGKGAVSSSSQEESKRTDSNKNDEPELRWVALVCDLVQLLSERPARFSPAVCELGTYSLCACAAQLPFSAKEGCVTHLMEALQQRPLCGAESEAAPAAEGPLVFSFQFLTELLLEDNAEESRYSASVWDSLDGPLRLQMQCAVGTVAAASPPSNSSQVALSSSAVTALQECWSRLLCCFCGRLPQTIAALVEDIIAGLPAGAPQESRRACLFTPHTLIAVSSTLRGWAALQPHLPQLSSVLSSLGRWGLLLQGIIEFADDAAVYGASVSPPASARTPSPGHKPAKSVSPRELQYRDVDFLSPSSVALCLRWCTFDEAHRGLVTAAREALQHFLSCVQRSGTACSADQWPLQWPVEASPHAGTTDVSYGEDTARNARHVRSLVCYQSLALLLTSIELPTAAEAVRGDAEDNVDAVDCIWVQLKDLWLAPAQLLDAEEGGRHTSPPPSSSPSLPPTAPTTTSRLHNYPPFDEDSLLTLLCALTLCILVRPSAEYKTWLCPDVVPRRLRPLRRLCVERRGVDPVYFMVRYITSGKGRKRLPAILLDGCDAELTVDTVIDVSDFTDGEDLPMGEVAVPVSETAVDELLHAAFPCVEDQVITTATSPPSLSPHSSAVEKTKDSVAQPTWSHGLWMLARTLLSHQTSLRTTPAALCQLLASRSTDEWNRFVSYGERALAVSTLLESDWPAAVAALRSAHVDVVYLASLCVSSWLQLPATHTTSARRKLAWAALQYFAHNGIAAYDALVARSLTAHVERLQRDSGLSASEAVIFPQSRVLPLPSTLFVLLTVKPLTLATP